LHWVILEDVKIPQHVANRAIAVTSLALGAENRFVHPHLATRVSGEHLENALNLASGVRPSINPVEAIAPALIIGLRGRPVSGSRLIELNASPVGSTPTFSATSVRP
jgi:hypothetical protein